MDTTGPLSDRAAKSAVAPSAQLAEHPHFTPWTDPVSGVVSYVLTERVAPVQQSFYFTNASVSADERWLWFYTAFPPGPHHTLGVVSLDPARPLLRHFPGATFTSGSPMVAPEGDAVYFCSGAAVWRQPIEGAAELVCRLDEAWVNKRALTRLATHLTLSADGRYFLLDGQVGGHWFVGLGDRESGGVTILKEFGRHYNHAQFSPHDPALFLIAQDWWHDPISGQHFDYDHRTWLMDTAQTRFEPISPQDWYRHNTAASHEWWSADGLVCWVDYIAGVFEYDPASRETRKVWQGPLCHAHCDTTRRYWCADQSPYTWDRTGCQVRFYDRERGAERSIVSELPLPPYPRSAYHIDPHPQFSPRNSWIVYTTTVRGQVDVALTPVGALVGTGRE